MGLGVLEPTQSIVPGTIQLYDSVVNVENTAHLKHAKDGKTILAPQPSDSPNDPLNWPTWRKDFVFAMLLMGGILSGVHGPILSPVTVSLAGEFDTSITAIAQLSSYMLLVLAGVAYIDSTIAHIYGKRAIFIASMAILVIADAWASRSQGYGSLLGARILSGAGQAAFECISSSVVADLYFVHQRGKRIGLFIILFGTGVYLGVPIATQIIDNSSWRNAFIGLAVTEGIMLLLLFLFFEEPCYSRFHVDPLANMSETEVLEKVNDPTIHDEESKVGPAASGGSVTGSDENVHRINTAAAEPRRSYLSTLRLYTGRYSHNNFFHLLYRSIILTFHPTVLWVATSGLILSWPVGISYTAAAFLTLPPYNFGPQGVANLYLASWIGMVIALFAGSIIFGWLARWCARKNRNVYEPEFLLFQVIPGIIFSIMGLVGWGWGEAVGTPWIALAIFFALANGGAVMYNNAAIGYVIDAHREFAVESQVAIFAVKVTAGIIHADNVEYLPLWNGLLFRPLVGICGLENGLGRCFRYSRRPRTFGHSTLYLRQKNARVLEPSSFPRYPRYQALEYVRRGLPV
jgi:MFS family permease